MENSRDVSEGLRNCDVVGMVREGRTEDMERAENDCVKDDVAIESVLDGNDKLRAIGARWTVVNALTRPRQYASSRGGCEEITFGKGHGRCAPSTACFRRCI